jgi:hypothetical protein
LVCSFCFYDCCFVSQRYTGTPFPTVAPCVVILQAHRKLAFLLNGDAALCTVISSREWSAPRSLLTLHTSKVTSVIPAWKHQGCWRVCFNEVTGVSQVTDFS